MPTNPQLFAGRESTRFPNTIFGHAHKVCLFVHTNLNEDCSSSCGHAGHYQYVEGGVRPACVCVGQCWWRRPRVVCVHGVRPACVCAWLCVAATARLLCFSVEVELDLLNEVVGEPESLFAAHGRLLSVLCPPATLCSRCHAVHCRDHCVVIRVNAPLPPRCVAARSL